MNKRPIFIMSLDCEGLWGLADHVTDQLRPQFTNDRLSKGYRCLIDLLDKHRVKATFAFVGAFTLTEDEFQASHRWFRGLSGPAKKWVQTFETDADRRNFEGWLVPQALEVVRAASVHEIASHGFTHLPLDEASISLEEFSHEMEGVRLWADWKGLGDVATFIFPRNIVGFPHQLPRFGFLGYRCGSGQYPGSLARVRRLVREFNLWETAQDPVPEESPVGIPSGFFLNWRVGLCRYLPVAVTLARWRSILKDAIENGRVVHLWTHPHNFLTASHQFELLDSILREVNKCVDAGELVNMTQQEYCSHIRGDAAGMRKR